MSTAADVALATLLALQPDGDLDAAEALVAADFYHHDAMPGTPAGREGYRAVAEVLRTGFSDLRFEVDDVIAAGDRVAVRTWFTGTQDGPFMGMPPTGRRVRMQQVHIFRVEDGRIAELWAVMDSLGAMRQLGAIPGPGERV